MAALSCPSCENPAAVLLRHWSALASVNYWRCDRCRYVWRMSKDWDEGRHEPIGMQPPPSAPQVERGRGR